MRNKSLQIPDTSRSQALKKKQSPNHPVCVLPPIAPRPLSLSRIQLVQEKEKTRPEIFKTSRPNSKPDPTRRRNTTIAQNSLTSTCYTLRLSNKYHHQPTFFFHPVFRPNTKKNSYQAYETFSEIKTTLCYHVDI